MIKKSATEKKSESFAILRTEKLHSWGEIAAAGGHMVRSRPVPNADPQGRIEVLCGSGDPCADLRTRLKESGVAERKGGVRGIEVLLTASPGAFSSEEQIEAFNRRSVDWLREWFGEKNVVSVICHRDESTPHLTCLVAPVDETPRSRGPSCRLNARRWLGGKKLLSEMQTAFADAVRDLGLRRGIKHSQARHIDIKTFYGLINQGPLNTSPLSINPPKLSDTLTASARDHYTDHETRRIRKQTQTLYQSAKLLPLLHREKTGHQKTSTILQSKLDQSDYQYTELKRRYEEALQQLRGVDLKTLAEKLGLKPTSNKHLYSNKLCAIHITGNKFFDHYTKKGGGGAIDFVKHVLGYTYTEAVSFLAHEFSDNHAVASILYHHRDKAREIVHTAKHKTSTFIKPACHENSWDVAREYLIKKRGLDPDLIDELHKRHLLYSECLHGHTNIIFLNRNQTMAERHGISSRFKGIAAGSNISQGGLSLHTAGETHTVVIVESAIDAVSYYQLHKDETGLEIVSAGGARGTLTYIDTVKRSGKKVVCAYDSDEAGEKGYRDLREAYPDVAIERQRCSSKKDWNEELLCTPLQRRRRPGVYHPLER